MSEKRCPESIVPSNDDKVTDDKNKEVIESEHGQQEPPGGDDKVTDDTIKGGIVSAHEPPEPTRGDDKVTDDTSKKGIVSAQEPPEPSGGDDKVTDDTSKKGIVSAQEPPEPTGDDDKGTDHTSKGGIVSAQEPPEPSGGDDKVTDDTSKKGIVSAQEPPEPSGGDDKITDHTSKGGIVSAQEPPEPTGVTDDDKGTDDTSKKGIVSAQEPPEPTGDESLHEKEKIIIATDENKRLQPSNIGISDMTSSNTTNVLVICDNIRRFWNLFSRFCRFFCKTFGERKSFGGRDTRTPVQMKEKAFNPNKDESLHEKEKNIIATNENKRLQVAKIGISVMTSSNITQEPVIDDESLHEKDKHINATNENKRLQVSNIGISVMTSSNITKKPVIDGVSRSTNTEHQRCVTIQVLDQIETQATIDFLSSVSNLFGRIPYKLVSDVGELDKNSPLVIVCQIYSRLETDIGCALKGIQYDKTFVVLLLHTGLERSLPTVPSAFHLDDKDKYKNIKFIDIAYNMETKLYPCEMNENATNQLRSVLQNFMKTDRH